MSDKRTTSQNSKNKTSKKNSKHGFSLYTKIILTFLLLLAIAASAFVYNAWRQLNRSNAEELSVPPITASVEILTPAGAKMNANNSSQGFITPISSASETTENSNTDTTLAASDTTTQGIPIKPVSAITEIPVLPINNANTENNVQDNTGNSLNTTTESLSSTPTPPKSPNKDKGLDNLF